jgi:CelD/BcsL family acetyltransferase involved in cellulose biosynthesis
VLEELPGRRLRFAGGRVTSHAHLLTRPDADAAAWGALADWLGGHPNRWSLLEAAGSPRPSVGQLKCEAFLDREFRMPLPASFEEYLAMRPARIRREFARYLRRMEGAGGAMAEVAPADRAPVLERFLELHHARAASKGERHPQIDGRLMRLLTSLDAGKALQLRVMALTIAGRTAGVALTIEQAETFYLFNAGIDPSHMNLAPGICLRLECIRGAIERERLNCDLGAGDFRYKRDFGGVPRDRWRVVASSPALAGRLFSGARTIRRRIRAASQAS